MNIVVTGSSGLVGGALVPALEGAGHRVARLVRGDAAGDDIWWDPQAGRIDARGIEGTDAVVHLAGAGIGDKRWTDARKQEIRDSRVKGTSLLAETLAGLRDRPAVLVSASAVGYYGPRGDEALTEGSPPGSDFLAKVCLEWEAATAAAEQAGVRVVHIRSGIVLSAEGGVLKRMLWPFKMGVGGRIGNGRQYMSWISLDDEVGAIMHLLGQADVSGPVNVTGPVPVTNSEFTETLGRVLKRPAKIPTPIAFVKIPYGVELVHHLLLSGQRVLPERLEASGYRFRHASVEQALRAVLGKPAAA